MLLCGAAAGETWHGALPQPCLPVLSLGKSPFQGQVPAEQPSAGALGRAATAGARPVAALASRSAAEPPGSARVTPHRPHSSRAITVIYYCAVSQLVPVFKNNFSQIIRP